LFHGASLFRAVSGAFARLTAPHWRQRRFLAERESLPTRKSLGGLLGVNIFARVHQKASRSNLRKLELWSLEPEQLALFGPVGGQIEGQTHQPLCAEFRRVFAVDDGRDDIGC